LNLAGGKAEPPISSAEFTASLKEFPADSPNESEEIPVEHACDAVEQILAEAESKGNLESDSHTNEHSLQAVPETGRRREQQENLEQAVPPAWTAKRNRQGAAKRLIAVFSAAWECFWRVLKSD
jgi:hypothetical protein